MTPQQMLDQARKEYHALITGTKARVIVDQNGERVEFTATTASRLAQYIKSLEAQVNGGASHPGPARVWF